MNDIAAKTPRFQPRFSGAGRRDRQALHQLGREAEGLRCRIIGDGPLHDDLSARIAALRLSDRLGGHLVSGHVDGVGRVLSVHEDARAQRWRFAAPAPLLKYIAKKGSICVDGVSLTVNEVDGEGFEVALIPHTVSHTAFSQTAVGDAVNLEIDLVARYVERLLGERSGA